MNLSPESANVLAMILSAVVGPVVSFVTSYLKERTWPDWLKLVLTGAVSVVFAVLTSWIEGRLQGLSFVQMTVDEFIANLGIVFISSTSFYHGYFKKTAREADLTDNHGPGSSGQVGNAHGPSSGQPTNAPQPDPVPLTEDELELLRAFREQKETRLAEAAGSYRLDDEG